MRWRGPPSAPCPSAPPPLPSPACCSCCCCGAASCAYPSAVWSAADAVLNSQTNGATRISWTQSGWQRQGGARCKRPLPTRGGPSICWRAREQPTYEPPALKLVCPRGGGPGVCARHRALACPRRRQAQCCQAGGALPQAAPAGAARACQPAAKAGERAAAAADLSALAVPASAGISLPLLASVLGQVHAIAGSAGERSHHQRGCKQARQHGPPPAACRSRLPRHGAEWPAQ